ncbi:GntR family transcriptional regulator [Fusobacterium sp. PH5-44]|uniref:GntR family transcriptional regulator n=1 Tax=unclassified Fusobacterium TaxID=2648384 RepID=UPI003D2497BE
MLKVKSFSDAAYDEIKDRIIKGIYKPGESLNERALSDDFGISRTPVREALQKLSIEGWVLNEPYKKNEVRKFSLKDIIEAQKVRTALEILSIKEVVPKLSKNDFDHLNSLIEMQKETSNHDEFINFDRTFHEFLYSKTENSLLISLMENINDIVRYFGILALNLPGRNKIALKEHMDLLIALKEKDIESSKIKMEIHMENTTLAIIKRYENIE